MRFPPRGNPPGQSQLLANHLLPFYSISSSLTISESVWKTGRGCERESLTVVLTQHMCVCLKIVWRASWGLFLLMRAWRRHTPASAECEQMPGSGSDWIVGCDSHSVCFYCLRLHKDLIFAQWPLYCCWQVVWGVFSFRLMSFVVIGVQQEWVSGCHQPKADLLPVLGSPALDKAHANGAHPSELVHSLEPLVDWLCEQGSELLVVKDLQVTPWGEQATVRSQKLVKSLWFYCIYRRTF